MQQTNDSDSLYTFLAWLDHNKKQVIVGLVALAVLGAGFAIYNWNKKQAEARANKDLFAVPPILGPGRTATPSADAYLKVAQQHSGSDVGNQASLLAGGILFEQGKYAEAQTQFQKFITENEDSPFRAQASMGIAASLDAQNKPEAASKYQEVIQRYTGTTVVPQAKLALARIYENQNKADEALKIYDELGKSNDPRDVWRSEAMQRREQLLLKNPSLAKAPESPSLSKTVPLNILSNSIVKAATNAAPKVSTNTPPNSK